MAKLGTVSYLGASSGMNCLEVKFEDGSHTCFTQAEVLRRAPRHCQSVLPVGAPFTSRLQRWGLKLQARWASFSQGMQTLMFRLLWPHRLDFVVLDPCGSWSCQWVASAVY
eukprot:1150774-Pelagomonas_calceolata.AAC.2